MICLGNSGQIDMISVKSGSWGTFGARRASDFAPPPAEIGVFDRASGECSNPTRLSYKLYAISYGWISCETFFLGWHLNCKHTLKARTLLLPIQVARPCFWWQNFGSTLSAFIPAHPIALNIFPFVNPNFFHNIYSIVKIGVQIKCERRVRFKQIGVKIVTWDKNPKLSAS